MKEMMKEGLVPIVDILIGKERETVNTKTQTEDVSKEEKKEKQLIQRHKLRM